MVAPGLVVSMSRHLGTLYSVIVNGGCSLALSATSSPQPAVRATLLGSALRLSVGVPGLWALP